MTDPATSANTFQSVGGRVDLGPGNAIGDLPRRVEIDGHAWFLATSSIASSRMHLLSGSCPHQGGRIEDVGACFECPNHGWRFDRDTGASVNSPGLGMRSVAVTVESGRLIARVPVATMADGTARARPLPPVDGLTIALHAHACLEFTYRGFSLLTDPWLVGPAFCGAWTQYPPPVIDVRSVRPNAVWISHEHSDHFHESTLAHLDRTTPVYFPDFPNRRIADRLKALGFVRAHALPFGVAMQMSENFTITCHEPGSLWNDSVVLIEIAGFRFLNLNDAGLNRRVARAVGPVDVMASSFSPGASGYPFTWTHLSDDRKNDIAERARQGHLRMLREAVDLYGARAVLPFASHFSLWHPSHEHFVTALKNNTLDDVVRMFAASSTVVIDLAPGDAWNGTDASITRSSAQNERGGSLGRRLAYLRGRFDENEFAAHHPTAGTPEREHVEKYFLRLNDTPDVRFCEDLVVRVQTTDDNEMLANVCVEFQISAGRLSILELDQKLPNLSIEIPAGILSAIIHHNLSWDEAHIGYWCRFSRDPDVYHAGFWRLLQAPYFNKPSAIVLDDSGEAIHPQSVLAGVLETYGPAADRVIRRYGLYCVGCQHSTADTLAHAARVHGLDDDQLSRIVAELNAVAATHACVR